MSTTTSKGSHRPVSPFAWMLIAPIRVYQWTLSPLIRLVSCGKGCCRFEPSCSKYAVEAIKTHGAFHGTTLTFRRLMKCHPWGPCGWDPVPPSNSFKPTSLSSSTHGQK